MTDGKRNDGPSRRRNVVLGILLGHALYTSIINHDLHGSRRALESVEKTIQERSRRDIRDRQCDRIQVMKMVENEDLHKSAEEQWGFESQADKWIEEMSELTQALLKMRRKMLFGIRV